MLLESGADRKNEYGALVLAAGKGHLNVVHLLVQLSGGISSLYLFGAISPYSIPVT